VGRNAPKRSTPGRRSLLTKETEWRICDAIRNGHTQAAAARAAGINPNTLSRWLREGRLHRAGKFRRLLQAVEEARSRLGEDLDNIEIEIAKNRSLPASTRLRAVQMIRGRVFGHAPGTAVDVYHHHDGEVQVAVGNSQSRDEEPPRSLVTDRELNTGEDEVLAEMLEALRQARARMPAGDSQGSDDVIDAEEVA